MTLATNLIGRPCRYRRPQQGDKPEETFFGFVCAVFPPLTTMYSPYVAIETKAGKIVTAPIDSVWLLLDLAGRPTEMGSVAVKEIGVPDAAATDERNREGTPKHPGGPTDQRQGRK